MTYHVQFLLLVLAGWVNRQQQDVIDVSGGCKLHICGGRKLHTRHPLGGLEICLARARQSFGPSVTVATP